jgi:hypothetical protein
MPGKYGQASTSAPAAEKLESTRRDRKKGGPREYTHTHMGVHEDILKKGGEEIRNSAGIGSFSNGMLFI